MDRSRLASLLRFLIGIAVLFGSAFTPAATPDSTAPSVTLDISPSSITLGGSATLTWSSSSASSCSFSGAYSASVATRSSTSSPLVVKPTASGSYSYTLNCTGAGGTGKQSASLTVTTPAPTVSLSISPASIAIGSNASLSWSSTDATSCSFSGNYHGGVATQSGSSPVTVKPIWSAVYTYTLNCKGAGGSTSKSVTLDVLSTFDQRIVAAQQTAANPSPTSSCGAINQNSSGSNNGFYWEIGNVNGILADSSMGLSASGSEQPTSAPGQTYTRTTLLAIDSASKWMYASYIAEINATPILFGWQMPSRYVPFLNFTSGYDNMTDSCSYTVTPTVDNCVDASNGQSPAQANGSKTAADAGRFYYNSGHMEVLEAGADPSLSGYMNGGANTVTDLSNELMTAFSAKGISTNIQFGATIPAGGIATTAGDYAAFLQGMLKLNTPLVMRYFLSPTASDPYAVCTNPYDASCVDSTGNPLALYAPLPGTVSWHYSLGHWIEDDPATGDGAYSSPGRGGFYPWIDSSKMYYGIVARSDSAAPGNPSIAPFYLSVVCGEAIRKAYMTATVQP
jgi:hypothetical protein